MLERKKIRIACDNEAVVHVLNSGKTRDLTLAAIARNIQFQVARGDINLQVVHIPGKDNTIADLLSRWAMTEKPHVQLAGWLPHHELVYLIGLPPRLAPMAKIAAQKTQMAFRPGTQRSYQSMFRLFLAFTVFMQVSVFNLSPVIVISYLQFLTTNNVSPPSLANHLSAIKASLSIYGLPTHIFQDSRIRYFQKAVALHKPFKPCLKSIIDIDTLHLIVRACDSTYMGQVFKAVYTLAFFSFLRISNLVPQAVNLFSPLYHLARGDVIFAAPGLHLIIK